MRQFTRLCGAAALALAATVPATAGPYTANVIFGDSLSDNGNLAELLGENFASPPFHDDAFTNGETAMDVLDDDLGLSTDPSLYLAGGRDAHGLGLTPGTNYAVAGATASDRSGGVAIPTPAGALPVGNLPEQLGAYLAGTGGKASTGALYTVFIGGNDVRTAAHTGNDGLATAGADAEIAALRALLDAGATNLLVVDVPDIGAIPETRLFYGGAAAEATADTDAYNAALLAGVTALKAGDPRATITYFDLNAFSKGLTANPGAYGIVDTADYCYDHDDVTKGNGAPFSPTAACQADGVDHLAYWDPIHPTATVHAAIGEAMYADLTSSVPEPGTWATMLAGLALLGAGLRRRASGVRAAVAA